MLELHSADVWTQLRRLREGRAKLFAAIAYVTNDDIVAFREGDVLITDASDAAIKNGETSVRVLARALQRGASVFSLPNLHAKVICTAHRAIIGSANLSKSSQTRLIEAVAVSDRPELVSAAFQFINKLCAEADVIDDDFIRRTRDIPVERKPFRGGRGPTTRVRLQQGRTWLVGLSNNTKYPGDEDVVEAVKREVAKATKDPDLVDWFWWPRSAARFVRLAREGDRIIACVRPSETDHSTRGVRVYKQAVVLKIFPEPGTNLLSYHYADPAESQETSLTWKQFSDLAMRVRMPMPKVTSVRELSAERAAALYDLWPK